VVHAQERRPVPSVVDRIDRRAMSRLTNFGAALAAGTIALTGLLAAPAQATIPVDGAKIIGRLGIEGGAYPGRFRPTAGTATVEFDGRPLVLVRSVGASGRFTFDLSPGTYTLIGCGPSASAAPSSQCSAPRTVTLTPLEVDHVRLVWLLAP